MLAKSFLEKNIFLGQFFLYIRFNVSNFIEKITTSDKVPADSMAKFSVEFIPENQSEKRGNLFEKSAKDLRFNS